MKSFLSTFICTLVLSLSQIELSAQQLTWNFSGGVNSTGSVSNLTSSSIAMTRVNNVGTTIVFPSTADVSPVSSGNGLSGGRSANCVAATGAVVNTSTSTYLQVILNPATNYWVNITDIRWGNFVPASTGPTTFSIYTNKDNYANPVATVTNSSVNTWNLLNPITTSTSPITGITSTPLNIRIYASGATAATAATINWRIDDLQISVTAQTGIVGQIPKYSGPSTFNNSVINESMAGNIGIGLTSATEKLDVNGKIKATGLIIPTGAFANRVLTSDASGNATWQLPAGSTNYWTLAGNGLDISNNNIGSVGIGTIPSYHKLEVRRDGANSAHLGLRNESTTPERVQASFGQNGIDYAYFGLMGTTNPYIYNAESPNDFGFRTDNKNIYFSTNAGVTSMATFTRLGNVGIGTTTPTEKLSVNGNIWSSGYAKLDAQSVFQVPTVKIGFDGTNYEAMHITGNAIITPVIKMDNIVYAINNEKAIIDIAANNTYMYGSNGSGAALKYTVSQFNPISTSNWGVYMDLQNSSAGSQNSIFPYYAKVKTANGNAFGYYANATINSGGTGKAYAFYAENGMSYFSGNVGVGTETPTEKLEVNGGNIYTNGKILINQANTSAVAPYALAVNGSAIFTKATVKLNINWPDYVFEQSYKLPSLADLEQYIQKNKHLPEIPSADDVKKNGIDLGNNQTLLLKKVEELTLYIIEQNKKIELLQAEKEKIALLQSQIDELKKLIQEQKK